MIVPIVLALGTAGAVAWKKRHKKPTMTAQDKVIFDGALKDSKTLGADKLNTLAAAFEKKGAKAEAGELRKRATLLSAPPEVQEQRKTVFKQAMNSTNATGIQKVAEAFHKTGHYEAAAKLRKYAGGLLKNFPGVKKKAAAAAAVAGERTPEV